MPLAQLVFQLHPDGKWKDAAVTNYGDLPAPLDLAALESLFPTLNAAAVARVAELEAENAATEADRDLARSKLTEIATVAESATADNIDAVKVEIVAKADEGKGSALQKEIDALQAEIAAEQIRLAELQAKLP